nr:hypothetical protein [uncultured Acetatifactor sp.]
MSLAEMIGMEMENISKEDENLLADAEFVLGACGIVNGNGSCGTKHEPC